MDFRQISQPGAPRPTAPTTVTEPEHRPEKASGDKKRQLNWLQLTHGIMLIGIALLVACVALAVTNNGNAASHTEQLGESRYVQSSKYQAVFLSNGQVYFGNVTSISSDYIRMTNVFYLTQESGTDSSDYTLVKLGCQQIHNPYDQIVINHSQVTFWENLQDDGKVVQGIKDFNEQNPDGPDCSQVSTQTQADSTTNTQGGTAKP